MALPTQDVTWGGTKLDPGSVKKAAGWSYKNIITYKWLNWIFGAYGDFINYFKDDIVQGRDATYGYQYDSSLGTVQWSISPTSIQFMDIGVLQTVIDASGTPIYAHPYAAGVTTSIAKIPLSHFLQFVASDEPTQPSVTVTNMRIRGKMGATGQVIVRLMKAATFSGSSAGAATIVDTWTPALGTSYTDISLDVSIDLFSPNFVYWVEVEMGTAGTATDTAVQGLRYTVKKQAIEGKPTTPA